MKKLIVSFVLILVFCIHGFTQIKDSKRVTPQNIATVIVVDGDQLRISQSTSQEILVESFLLSKGFIVGYKNPWERPLFEIKTRISGDTLFILAPIRYSPTVVGIKTYIEHIETKIEMPPHLNLVIKESNIVKVDGTFQSTKIFESRVANISISDKNIIRSLICLANDCLKLNGSDRSSDFEFSGTGKSDLLVHADEINLMIEGYQ